MSNLTNEIPCGCETLRTTALRIWHHVSCRACAEVSAALEVSCRPAQRSQQLQNLTILIVNVVASCIHLHNFRCFQGQLRMLLQRLRAYCKAPGGAGSIWKYLEALVRATGVSGRFACGFLTDLHFPDVWRLALHFDYQISQKVGINKRKRTQCTVISPMGRAVYALSYHKLSEWRPVIHFRETWSAEDSQNPQARPFSKESSEGNLLKPITGYWQPITKHCIWPIPESTENWTQRQRNRNCIEWPRSLTSWRCNWAANIYVLLRRNPTLKTRKWQPWDSFQIVKISARCPGQTFNMMVQLHLTWWKDNLSH